MKKLMMAGCGLFFAFAACATDASFVDLFDGKTLTGWKVRGGTGDFYVQDGLIVGKGGVGDKVNTFLCTEKDYENFIFRVEFKLAKGNSGVQFRSSAFPCKKAQRGDLVVGYQSEITDNGGNMGRIYDEERRGYVNGIIFLDQWTPAARQEAAKKSFKPGDWNVMEVQCVGTSIKTWLNGNLVSDIIDECQLKGFIGLQMHAQRANEKPLYSYWRNPRLKVLPSCPSISLKGGVTNELQMLNVDLKALPAWAAEATNRKCSPTCR